MSTDFNTWLAENGLALLFTTITGDSFYVNREKRFGVVRTVGTYSVQSFYLDDIIEIKTKDDEKLVYEWTTNTGWKIPQRSTSHSTNEVYMKLRMKNTGDIRLQIFKATGRNVERNTYEHANLINYACQISHAVFAEVTGCR